MQTPDVEGDVLLKDGKPGNVQGGTRCRKRLWQKVGQISDM